MAEVDTEHAVSQSSAPNDDPLARLHKMSTTAGVGSTDYVAINPMAVATLIVGFASAAAMATEVLLLIPVVGVIFGIVALRQISNSNGTQTGKSLAIAGIVLSIGIAGYVIGHWAMERRQYNQHLAEIDQMVQKFGGYVHTGNFDAAYDMLTPKMQGRVSRELFSERMKVVQMSPLYGRIMAMRGNNLAAIKFEPTVNFWVATSQVLINWEKVKEFPGREEFRFEKIDGQWLVHDIPTWFPPPAAPGQAGPGQGGMGM